METFIDVSIRDTLRGRVRTHGPFDWLDDLWDARHAIVNGNVEASLSFVARARVMIEAKFRYAREVIERLETSARQRRDRTNPGADPGDVRIERALRERIEAYGYLDYEGAMNIARNELTIGDAEVALYFLSRAKALLEATFANSLSRINRLEASTGQLV
jgi:hypothetical protein